MPVFTFIGQTLSKQDNQVTFDIIIRTTTTIMPQLIEVKLQENSALKVVIIKLLLYYNIHG